MLDYSNLGARAEVAKENLEKGREPLELGTFDCVLRQGEFGKSRAGNDMFTLHMRVKDKKASERMQDETLRIRFVVSKNTEHQVDQFLSIMKDWGCDLSKVKKPADWEDLFIDLAAARAKATIEVEQDAKNDKYYNFNWLEIVQALGIGEDDEIPELPEKKKTSKKSKAKAKAQVEETEDDGDDEDDW